MDIKIARICWNTTNWKRASGKEGKSTDVTSFEVNPGFGHEEWIFDFKRLIDGYKYTYLEPINTDNLTHASNEYVIYLYAIYNGNRILIAKINRATCLTEKEAEHAYTTYKNNGWLSKMGDDLTKIGISPRILEQSRPIQIFNLKYKESDIEFIEPRINISYYLLKNPRYILQNVTTELFQHIEKRIKSGSDSEIEDDISEIINNIDLSASEKENLVKSRIGQGIFRRNVIRSWGNGERCAVTYVGIKELLIASHIKAWKECSSTNERLDGANGILLCAHIDKLFDRHLITFIKKGGNYILKISPKLNKSDLAGLGIEENLTLISNKFNIDETDRFDDYLRHHNEIFNEKSNSE